MLKQKHIIIALITIIFVVPLGFYSKLYTGIGHEWVNNKFGGVLYEIFWCLVFFILLPKSKPMGIALWVFIITCLLEFVQLLSNNLLEIIRSNFIGQTLIGNSFSWTDFPYYIAGSIVGYLILRFMNKYKLQPVDK